MSDSLQLAPLPPIVPPGADLPHRKVIRSWLAPICQRTTLLPLALLALDLALFALALSGVALLEALALRVACGLAAGFVIGRLFILGHDACHQSLTPHRALNRWLGRIAFLPSLTPYSLWDVGHNVVHHGYTNLRGVDFVWQPKTAAEFAALPPWRRLLERMYRSGWGPALYYFVEMWWLRMFFPSRRHLAARRRIFTLDCLLVSLAGLGWIGALWAVADLLGRSPVAMVALGFVVPFAFWNAMIGFVVYVHHTHESVEWHADKSTWAKAAPFVSTTVHLRFPGIWGALMHHIMEHTAHHVDMSIPLYRLKAAQALLERTLPGRIVVQDFSWAWYFDTARRCKLYDYDRNCWTDFAGRRTS